MPNNLLARKIKDCRRKMDDKSCVTPAGESNELDVQNNKWEENTHTYTHTCQKTIEENGAMALSSCILSNYALHCSWLVLVVVILRTTMFLFVKVFLVFVHDD